MSPCKEQRAAPWHAWSKNLLQYKSLWRETRKISSVPSSQRIRLILHLWQTTLSHFEYRYSNIIFRTLDHTECLTHIKRDINPWGFMVLWGLWILGCSFSDPYLSPPPPLFAPSTHPPNFFCILTQIQVNRGFWGECSLWDSCSSQYGIANFF